MIRSISSVLIFTLFILLSLAYSKTSEATDFKSMSFVTINPASEKYMEKTVNKNLSNKTQDKEIEYSGHSPLFRTFAYAKNFVKTSQGMIPVEMDFEKRANQTKNYKKIMSNGKDTVVISPTFTVSAYAPMGFYHYYHGSCDTKCLTTKIRYDLQGGYTASSNAVKILSLLNYDKITDVDVDKSPKILSKYKKVIVLHNEYVTQKEFDAITAHPNVIYLYPNALYAKISVNYANDTITLVRGHGYPDKKIQNGFDWKYDNSKLEYDNICANWQFTKIPNGKALNCYPENIIFTDYTLLKYIRYN